MDLMEFPPPRVDAAQVMATLRRGLTDRRDCRAAGRWAPDRGGAGMEKIWVHMTEAERHANVGGVAPALERFHRLIRPAARLMARAVLYVGRFIVTPQRHFNFAVLRIARVLTDRACESDRRQEAMAERMEELERIVSGQADRIEVLSRLVQRQINDDTDRRHAPQPSTPEATLPKAG